MRWSVFLLAGCALTSKAKPLEVQYYTPVIAVASAPPAGSTRARVRLGRVQASTYLRTEVVYRDSDVELGLYETKRWTDSPDVYVRRSLEQALFAARPIEQVTGGPAPTLEVDLIAFEEITAPSGGRVQLAYRLRDDDLVVASGVVTVKRDAHGTQFPMVVAAISEALDAATAEIAEVVLKHTAKEWRAQKIGDP